MCWSVSFLLIILLLLSNCIQNSYTFLYHEQTRVSGVMTNAPFILNVDCDMYVHNPKIVLHALCILLDSKGEKEVGFAQCIQQFYDALKDDPFGNQLVATFLVSQVSQSVIMNRQRIRSNEVDSMIKVEKEDERNFRFKFSLTFENYKIDFVSLKGK